MVEPHTITPQDVIEYRCPRDAHLSPDGRWIVYTMRDAAKAMGAPEQPGELWLANVAEGTSRQLTYGAGVDQSPRWSPDSTRIVCLSDREKPGQRQVYALRLDGGDPQRLTSVQGWLDAPAWSPDGRAVAFLCTASDAEPLSPGADMHVMSRQRYQRVYAIDVETHSLRALTPDGYQIHEFAWSSDGSQLAVIAKQGDDTPSGWYTAQLYVIDVTGSEPGSLRQVVHAERQIMNVTWSPDGKQIAYLTSFVSDQPLWQGDLCIADVESGDVRQVTPRDMPFSFTKLDWLEPNSILYSARQLDGTSFGRVDPQSGETRTLWSGYAMIGDWTVPRISINAEGRTFAAILESPDTPPQVYTADLDAAGQPWRQVSHLEYAPLRLGRMERTAWRADDGLEIVGHIVYPVDYEAGKRYPTFVQIHGGPAWGWLPHYAVWWEWWYQYLAGQGYLVLLPNIRGSTGRGTAFTEANIPDLGGGDFRDVLSGVDHVVALGLADPDRVGIGGWSYGGFMTSWAITQTTRFKVAIMGAGLASWESYYGQNSIRDWQRVYFGSTPYDDPELHRVRSPLTHIHNVTTPTLILHGEEDHDVSPTQSREMYIALHTLGVPVELVTYPRENHPIHEREHQVDLLTRVLDWCDKYLKKG